MCRTNERGPLRDWSLAILSALEPAPSPSVLARGNAAVSAFLELLRTLVAERRRQPGDPDVDVLTRLIQGEHDGERLSETELLHNCIFLLNAGHETTTNLIGNGVHALLDPARAMAAAARRTGAARQRDRGTAALREPAAAEQPHHYRADRTRRP